MAVIFNCRFSWRRIACVILAPLILSITVLSKGKKLKKILSKHCYTISISISILLGLLNILVYHLNCPLAKSLFSPIQLSHGHSPVFPSHFFHRPNLSNVSVTLSSVMLQYPKQLDMYLHNNVLQHSLSAPTTPVVHVIWCDTGSFTFTHYLSVLAAFKAISPSVLYLHVIKEPYIDHDGYFQFLPDLLRDLPPFITKTLKYQNACYGSTDHKTIAYMNILNTLGGIVINGRIVLAPSPNLIDMLNNEISIATQKVDSMLDLLILTAQANVLHSIPSTDSLKSFLQSHTTKHYQCTDVRHFSFSAQEMCVYVHEDMYPVIIFNGSSEFYHLARWIVYGTSDYLISTPADHVIVPNIVHYVWLGEAEMKFFAYLSIKSSLYVLKADVVYVHGDYKPLGDLWKEIEQNPKVKFIHRDFPTSVYGEPIRRFASHASDYLRADLLLRYGGVYTDWDVIFLKELPLSLRLHNTTANVDWPETGAFPDVFNLGILISAPGAPFLRHFLESYRWYLDRHWSYNAIHMPYKVYEKHPRSLNVDRHLQILCASDKCHATWLPGYKQESDDHLNSGKLNWQTDALAIHWTHPDPAEFTSQLHLLASDTVTGQIGKFVLEQANIKLSSLE